MEAATVGDEDALKEIHMGVAILRALRTLRNDCNVRNALLVLGHYYFDATLNELGVIFHLDKSTISKYISASSSMPERVEPSRVSQEELEEGEFQAEEIRL